MNSTVLTDLCNEMMWLSETTEGGKELLSVVRHTNIMSTGRHGRRALVVWFESVHCNYRGDSLH